MREQERIGNQVDETEALIAVRVQGLAHSERLVHDAQLTRSRLATDLETETRAYVSDEADQIAEAARRQEELAGAIEQLTDYLTLYRKVDESQARVELLAERVTQIQAQLQARQGRRHEADERINVLEQIFARLVEEVELPRFDGEPRAAINRETYLPVVNGRTFNQLSSGGLKVLTNVAYALAHHESSVEQQLILPGLLMLDNVTKNVGRDEYDWARVEAVFRALIRLSDQYGESLQLIVSANDVPDFALDHVRLRLSETDRLIPATEA